MWKLQQARVDAFIDTAYRQWHLLSACVCFAYGENCHFWCQPVVSSRIQQLLDCICYICQRSHNL